MPEWLFKTITCVYEGQRQNSISSSPTLKSHVVVTRSAHLRGAGLPPQVVDQARIWGTSERAASTSMREHQESTLGSILRYRQDNDMCAFDIEQKRYILPHTSELCLTKIYCIYHYINALDHIV